jgi:hypothetical protein
VTAVNESQRPEGSEKPGETDWERRKRLAAVFGDVLPETTRDDRDGDEPDPGTGDRTDDWLRSQVPPHHG